MRRLPAGCFAVGIVMLIAALSGCGLNPVRMPIPDLERSETLSVTVDFSSALNLPAGAKVAYEGNDVGLVRGVTLERGVVAVNTALDATANIPGDCHAAIVQDTVLGDSYIRLTRPPSVFRVAAPPLTDEAHIPVSRTLPPTSLEDMMSTLSSFIGTGSIQQMEGALRHLNSAMPQSNTEMAKISGALATNLRSLAQHTDELNQSIGNVYELSRVLNDRADNLQDLLSDDSLRYWSAMMTTLGYIGVLLPSISSVFTNGYWLIPLFDSVSTVFEQAGVAGGGDPAPFNEQLGNFVGNTLLPFMQVPRIDVTDIRSTDGRDRIFDTQTVLRNIGAIR